MRLKDILTEQFDFNITTQAMWSAAYCSAAAMKDNAENKENRRFGGFCFMYSFAAESSEISGVFSYTDSVCERRKSCKTKNTPRKNSHGVSEGDFSFQENGIKREKLLPRLFSLFSSDPIDVPFKVAAV